MNRGGVCMNFEYTLNGVSKKPEEFTEDEIEALVIQFCEPLGIDVKRKKQPSRKKVSGEVNENVPVKER